MPDNSYNERQLQPLLNTRKDYPIKVKFSGEIEGTNWMDINLDSIESIQAFLEILKEDLEREEKLLTAKTK